MLRKKTQKLNNEIISFPVKCKKSKNLKGFLNISMYKIIRNKVRNNISLQRWTPLSLPHAQDYSTASLSMDKG